MGDTPVSARQKREPGNENRVHTRGMKAADLEAAEKFEIIRVDNDIVEKAELVVGTNRIGRSDAATDVRPDERYRFRLDVTPDNEIFLTPAVSGCYAKFLDSAKWQILEAGHIVPVKPGDVFSLLPERCWFKIISVPIPETVERDPPGDKPEERTVNAVGSSIHRIPLDHRSKCHEMSETTTNDGLPRSVPAEETVTLGDRSSCKYRERCYRKSAEHKAKFSHPGDPDYDETGSDQEEDRPECPYGLRCYRKNPLHVSRYRHTGSGRRSRVRGAVTTDQRGEDSQDSEEESVDESEYEPEADEGRTTEEETDTDRSDTDD